MSRRKKIYNEGMVETAWDVYNEAVAKARREYDAAIAVARKQINESIDAAIVKDSKVKKP